MSNRATFDASQDFLRQMLRMPESARIVGASFSDETGFVTFAVEDPNLPEGDRKVHPQLRKVETLVWDWNVEDEPAQDQPQEADPHAGHDHG